MDIVTHAMVGAILSGPFLAEHPAAASGFLLGSVLPDMDSLSRLGGKGAFLRAHQTWSHALPLHALGGALGALALLAAGSALWALPLGLAAGCAVHTLLDLTNTYGVTAWAPFSRRRIAYEWMFFVDSGFLALTVPAAVFTGLRLRSGDAPSPAVAAAYLLAVLTWTALRAQLRRRAGALARPGTLALIPSALLPWIFLGVAREGEELVPFRLDLLRCTELETGRHRVLDERYAAVLEELPEFRAMRELSPAYHAVEVRPGEDGAVVVCRDLRTRNFGGSFGTLEVELDPEGGLRRVEFHV